MNKKTGQRNIITAGMLLAVFIIFCADLNAQIHNWPSGARAAGLSNAYVMEADIWSVQHNQAGLGFYPHFSIGFHHENKFIVDQYAMHSLAMTLPVRAGTFGFSYTYFGYKIYNQSKVGLGFGKMIGEDFSAGIQLNLHHIYLQSDYGNRNALTFEGGIQYRPTDKIEVGAHFFNPTRATISPYEMDTIQTIYRTGIAYRPFDDLFLAVEAEKQPDRTLLIKTGAEYRLYESLYLRAGVVSENMRASFGVGYEINKIRADIAFTHHEILGFTPHFSLQVMFDKEKKKEPEAGS